MGNLTPMMQQYLAFKEQYQDCILMFRLGDFYEMFFDDAETASRELEITLTGRDCGLQERAPMCGVPYHSVEGYIAKLIEKGYKVAICEQVGEPSPKGLVERQVTRVITPGTVIEPSMLDDKKNNYIASLCMGEDSVGVAFCDISTGEFQSGEVDYSWQAIMEEISRIQPTEIIMDDNLSLSADDFKQLFTDKSYMVNRYQSQAFEHKHATKELLRHFHVRSLETLGMDGYSSAVRAAGALLTYFQHTQKVPMQHINKFVHFTRKNYMVIDHTTRRNLELTQSLRDNQRKGTLLQLLDKTVTSMGARLLRSVIEQPLQQEEEIQQRLDAVEELINDRIRLDNIRDSLKNIYDIARLCSKISYNTINARDCLAFAKSIQRFPEIQQQLASCKTPLLTSLGGLDPMEDMLELLTAAIAEDAPLSVNEGGIIKDGYHEQVDELRGASKNGREWIAKLEAAERESTGIKNLKIGYNRVFGYYIEVTKSYLSQVPYRYTRRQTLANSERFITEELKDLEATILGADEKCVRLEYELFLQIREQLSQNIKRFQQNSEKIAWLDVMQSLSTVALFNDYCKPELNTDGTIEIIQGRHPVVEKNLKVFIPNDTMLNSSTDRFLIITGPNMAGKSTYMRQVALITLMAHIGSFVPAKSANISLVDRIFTRVGASDDLYSGQSTFMVEMSEMASILLNATRNSLLIIDEIGRGTSTFDGLSIAWAVVEHICEYTKLKSKTLFATHYHELSELEGHLPGVKNYRISVKESGEDIVFLRKIVRGSADRSFGIQVARLAGMPGEVVKRAKEILVKLEANDINRSDLMSDVAASQQLTIYDANDEIINELKNIDVDSLTPLQALTALSMLKNKAKGEGN
ncbi:DNA mismatch repair protein MutS [Clostridia bacterium OttesenSCG-928-F22]|nr:DNA mismatch repair protein MutS [Clostridia bacterium OttesenSCG-928-F22]